MLQVSRIKQIIHVHYLQNQVTSKFKCNETIKDPNIISPYPRRFSKYVYWSDFPSIYEFKFYKMFQETVFT